jgi:2-C-methyl-D-erythritol 4-phosphate cytidylyltransferase
MPEAIWARDTIWAIVVAGGEGRRFGGAKQFLDLDGKSVLERSVTAARSVANHVVAVLPASSIAQASLYGGADIVVAGGEHRADSVRAALAVIPTEASVIVVHDAARPLATPGLFHEVIAALSGGAAGAIPGIGVTDTIKRIAGQRVVETLDRELLVAIQTPQAFRAATLREAHAQGENATDDAALLEQMGAEVVVILGDSRNIKLTDPRDVELALRYLRELQEEAAS